MGETVVTGNSLGQLSLLRGELIQECECKLVRLKPTGEGLK